MRNETVAMLNGRPVVVMDSISLITPADAGAMIICGSHGGAISGAFAAMHPPALVVFNDAGGGKKDAGVASLAALSKAKASPPRPSRTIRRASATRSTPGSTASSAGSTGRPRRAASPPAGLCGRHCKASRRRRRFGRRHASPARKSARTNSNQAKRTMRNRLLRQISPFLPSLCR
jgi:hypothetical protein